MSCFCVVTLTYKKFGTFAIFISFYFLFPYSTHLGIDRSAAKSDLRHHAGRIRSISKFVILSERSEVEGSSHLWRAMQLACAKVFRLRASPCAQDDDFLHCSNSPNHEPHRTQCCGPVNTRSLHSKTNLGKKRPPPEPGSGHCVIGCGISPHRSPGGNAFSACPGCPEGPPPGSGPGQKPSPPGTRPHRPAPCRASPGPARGPGAGAS